MLLSKSPSTATSPIPPLLPSKPFPPNFMCSAFQPTAFTQCCLCAWWRPVFCSMYSLSETMWLSRPQQPAVVSACSAWGGTSQAPPCHVGILVGLICGSCAHKSQLL